MFYTLDLSKELEIHPRFLGPKLKDEIYDRLRQEVEGYCTGKHGFVLAVTSLFSIGQGLIREGAGYARFNVQYRCITFMPHKGEVLDATVKSVNKMGFFAEAGPLQLFVSNHLIPEEFEFDTSHEPAYVTSEGDKIIPGSEVRVRIVGTRVDANEIFAVATMSDDFLGLMSIST
ncbi:hypothetical protein M9434_006205 [Picochlorum sp. BPE23]|nr:hypothetical protein M9434_006205 [Picochlorum sp. BPE23]KAI8108868.1 hypothetical protein M9435_005285 [Picochlorum sp. BPE23]|eukprot:CAMPEP_0118798818 /NCGR_PEP_ID=MMETSP1161-20130426/1156_1 /TAXON_ID=249345 /ORGANISM="Picochlorum oklahomensis, Strain CCMP2329" /LENGTH=173 /DNA_ID=CAMNT_0006726365 /DNA_START=78 /DNA_END=599 /DNA_ORIENTATION=-